MPRIVRCGARRLAATKAFLAAIALGVSAAMAGEPPPNFIVILVDDLGVGDLGSYGQTIIRTPRLDAMAAEGLRLARAYSGDAYCPVTRISLLTGAHAGHAAIRGPADTVPEDSAASPLFLQRLLQGAGYVTGMFGKWGLGGYDVSGDAPIATVGRPSEIGFDAFLGFLTHRDAHTQTLPAYPQEPGDQPIHDRLWRIDGGATVEDSVAVRPLVQEDVVVAALDFLAQNRDVPFFLYLPWSVPHAEYYLPEDDPAWDFYLDSGGESLFAETPFAGNTLFRRPVPSPKAAYAARVSRLDADVGRILDRLDELGIASRTLVVFASDNGAPRDAPYNNPGFFGSTLGLRGNKFELWEGGIRVPALLRWPSRIDPGLVADGDYGLWDVFPTILELAAIAPPPNDGISLVPLFDGGSAPEHDASRPLYFETWNALFRGQALRDGRWKLVRTGLDDPTGPVALYDLASDPLEQNDRAGDPALCSLLLDLTTRINVARTPPPGGGYSITPLALSCPIFRNGFESGDTNP